MRFSKPLVEIVPEGRPLQREFFGSFPGGYTMGTVIGQFRPYDAPMGSKAYNPAVEALRVDIDGVEHIAVPSMGHWRASPIDAVHPVPFDIVDDYPTCPECRRGWVVFGPAVVQNAAGEPTNKRRCIECKTVVRVPDDARVGA